MGTVLSVGPVSVSSLERYLYDDVVRDTLFRVETKGMLG